MLPSPVSSIKFTVLLAMLCTTALGLSAQNRQLVDPSKGAILSNAHVRFEFQPGGMGVIALSDLAGGSNHLPTTTNKRPLWEIKVSRGATSRSLDSTEKACSFAAIEHLPGGVQRAVFEWNDVRFNLEDRSLNVRVTVDLPVDSGVAEWRIFVENRSDYWGLASVVFPILEGFPEAGKYDIARSVFASGGRLIKAATERTEGRYPSGGWPMQFASITRGHSSVYFASMDGEGRAKDFVIEPGKRLQLTHYPENMGLAGSDWPDPYAVALGVYQGTWVEAAQRYREWALKQKWASAGRLSQRTDVPERLKNVALWVMDSWEWNGAKGTAQEMDAPLLEVQRRMGIPMALHWYNWHHMPFDNLYPHFLPPKPEFAERVRELTAHDLLVMPYINGSSADYNIPDFDKFQPHAIQDEGGGLRHTLYSEEAGRLLSMCPSQEFWHDSISKLIDDLARLGVNGVYVDQISAMEHELCFNPTHGHPLGGGHYWVDGNRALLRKVKNDAHRAGRDITITSEGADEVFFDLVDANLTWAQPSDLEIPLMQMVYSGYTIFFGSPSDFTRSDRFFRFAQGQALIDGRQNGWMGLDLFKPGHERKVEYLRQCGRYRMAGAKFLTYGQLLAPVEPSTPVATFAEDGFEKSYGVTHTGTVPAVAARLWRAEDGRLGLIFANYSDEPVAFPYRLDLTRYGLTSVKLVAVTPDGSKALGNVARILERTELLVAGEIRLIELIP
jgi:hypothetical protein